jgi:type 1 fimbria pilin
MAFTDNNNMANTSNLLSLTPSSTAKGIAVQISKADGTLVSFGPDSANQAQLINFCPESTIRHAIPSLLGKNHSDWNHHTG